MFLLRRESRGIGYLALWIALTVALLILAVSYGAEVISRAEEVAKRNSDPSPRTGLLVLFGFGLAAALAISTTVLRRLTASSATLRYRFGLRPFSRAAWARLRESILLWYWGSKEERNRTHTIAVWSAIASWLAVVIAILALMFNGD
jgi:hypothetical protein